METDLQNTLTSISLKSSIIAFLEQIILKERNQLYRTLTILRSVNFAGSVKLLTWKVWITPVDNTDLYQQQALQ